MRIDIIIDTICPWCYLGQTRFQQALAARPDLSVDLRWRPFQINPTLPLSGRDRESDLHARFGGLERARSHFRSLERAGEQEGINFRFDRIERVPNTLQSHRLIAFAARFGHAESAVFCLFDAYFGQGLDLGDVSTLLGLGDAIGLPADALGSYLAGDEDLAQIRAQDDQARKLGVSGVPCFIVDEHYAVSGAQSPEVFVQILDLARQDRQLQAAE